MIQFLNKTQDQRIKEKWAEFDKMAKRENDKLEKKNKTIASASNDLENQKHKINKTAQNSDIEKDVLIVEPLFKTKAQISKNETANVKAPKNLQANNTQAKNLTADKNA